MQITSPVFGYYPRLCWRGFSWGSTFTLDNAEFPLPEGQELCDSEVSVEIKHRQRLLAWPVCLGWLHSSLFSLHRWYLDELCCQKHAGTGKGGFPPHVGRWGPVGAAAWGAPGSAEAGWGWLRLPGTSRVLRADGSKKKKVGRTCKQSRLERKLIGGNFIWNAEALFLERLCFLLTTLQQLS